MTEDGNGIGARDLGLLLMRVMLGVVFLFHGAQKLFGAFDGGGLAAMTGFLEQLGYPLPAVGAFLAAASEFLGGALLVAGLFVRLAVIPMAFTMFVAAFGVHGGKFSAQQGGMEYPLTLGVMLIALGLLGAGRIAFSLPGRARR